MPGTQFETDSRGQNLHPSSEATLLGCARSYYLEYILQLPAPEKLAAVAGTACHAALEQHELARIAGEETPTLEEMCLITDECLVEMAAGLDQSALDALGGVAELQARAHAALWNFWHAPMDREGGLTPREWLLQYTPLHAELYLKQQLVDGVIPHAGSMDLVVKDDDGRVFIIDFKTARASGFSRWRSKNAVVDKRHQAVTYSTMLWFSEMYPEVTGPPEFVALVLKQERGKRSTFVGATTLHIQPNQSDLLALGQRARAAQRVLDLGSFPVNPDYQWCYLCPFRPECQEGDQHLSKSVTSLELRYRGERVA